MINRPKINRIQWIDLRTRDGRGGDASYPHPSRKVHQKGCIRLIFNFVGVSAEFDEAEKGRR